MPAKISKIFLLLIAAFFWSRAGDAQEAKLSFFQPADSLHRTRFWVCAGGGAAIYSGFSIGLYNTWYREFETTGFHTFDDWGEWEHMDKMGHAFTAYTESLLAYKGARWTGLPRRTSMWTGAAVGWGLQLTVEMMDAFSAKWGFSWSDIGFNTLGVGLFVGQEMAWREQRILMKVSASLEAYPDIPVFSTEGDQQMLLSRRATELFGTSFAERFLKDYNAQTTWLSINPASFLPESDQKSGFPRWLNIAIGYGGGNIYGGFSNTWTSEGVTYSLPAQDFPRYRQLFISPDIDLSRIPTRSHFVRTLLSVLNWVKIPAPTLEWNSRGQVRMHAFYW